MPENLPVDDWVNRYKPASPDTKLVELDRAARMMALETAHKVWITGVNESLLDLAEAYYDFIIGKEST